MKRYSDPYLAGIGIGLVHRFLFRLSDDDETILLPRETQLRTD